MIWRCMGAGAKWNETQVRAPDGLPAVSLDAANLITLQSDAQVSTLERLRDAGPGDYYTGDIARMIAADMAERIGETGMADQLDQRRDGMLEQHAFLQTRSVVSAMGHFGTNNPMTVPD